MLELVHVFPLVQKDLAVGVVDDGLLHNRGADDVVHLLGHHNGLTEIFPDGLEQILDIAAHVGGHKGFPTLLYQYYLADSFQTAHLGDEGLHDDQRHHRQQHLVAADVVQLEHDEPPVCQVQFPVGVQQEVVVATLVERLQHVQETVDVEILLAYLLFRYHPAVVTVHELVEAVEVRPCLPIPGNFTDIGVHRSRERHLFRTFRCLVLPFPQGQYQSLDALALFHIELSGIGVERVEGYRIVLLIRDVDAVPAACAVVDHPAQPLIAVARVHQQDMRSLLVIVAHQMVGEKGLAAAAWSQDKFVAVGDDAPFHRKVGNVHVHRNAVLPVRHADAERTGRTSVIGLPGKEADRLLQERVE